MILAHGNLYGDDRPPQLLEELEADCLGTVASQSISAETVIAACGALAGRIADGKTLAAILKVWNMR